MRQGIIALSLIISLVIPFLPREDAGATSTPAATDSSLSTQQIVYPLPYPGILPDHPLYPLKVLRDKLLEILIRDPAKKAEFYLLMADKRLHMGVFLTNKNKPTLAAETVADAEKYFLRGVEYLEKLTQTKIISLLNEKREAYTKAAVKHQEVITDLIKNTPENVKNNYNLSLQLLEKLQVRLAKIGG